MGYNWIDDTMNRNRRSGARWLHDIGQEEVQKGFFQVLRDLETGHFDYNKHGFIFFEDIFMNESYAAARYKSQELAYKLTALSSAIAADKGDVDEYIQAEYSSMEYDAYILNTYRNAVDVYRYSMDANAFIVAIDNISTLGKRKKLIRDKIELDIKPTNVTWCQYKNMTPNCVDRFLRGIIRGKTPVSETYDVIQNNPMMLMLAINQSARKLKLYTMLDTGLKMYLDANIGEPYALSLYPSIKRSQTAYAILHDGLVNLSGINIADPMFRGNLTALKSTLMKDYNGAI